MLAKMKNRFLNDTMLCVLMCLPSFIYAQQHELEGNSVHFAMWNTKMKY